MQDSGPLTFSWLPQSLQFCCLTYVLHLFKVVIIFSEAGEVNISLVVSVVRADVMI